MGAEGSFLSLSWCRLYVFSRPWSKGCRGELVSLCWCRLYVLVDRGPVDEGGGAFFLELVSSVCV